AGDLRAICPAVGPGAGPITGTCRGARDLGAVTWLRDDPCALLSPDAQLELRNGGAADGARLLRTLLLSRFAVCIREPGSSPRPVDQRRPALGGPIHELRGKRQWQ